MWEGMRAAWGRGDGAGGSQGLWSESAWAVVAWTWRSAGCESGRAGRWAAPVRSHRCSLQRAADPVCLLYMGTQVARVLEAEAPPQPDIIDKAAAKAREWAHAILVNSCVATKHLQVR